MVMLFGWTVVDIYEAVEYDKLFLNWSCFHWMWYRIKFWIQRLYLLFKQASLEDGSGLSYSNLNLWLCLIISLMVYFFAQSITQPKIYKLFLYPEFSMQIWNKETTGFKMAIVTFSRMFIAALKMLPVPLLLPYSKALRAVVPCEKMRWYH